MAIKNLLVAIFVSCTAGMAPNIHAADTYPTKPVKVVIGFGAGSAIDTTLRIIGEKFLAISGQPLIVEPKPGAAGNLAAEHLARAEPDGYTLLSGSVGMMTINNLIYANPGYDPVKDFAPIVRISRQHLVLAVNKDIPANNFAEFLAYVRARPGKVSYASFGAGTESHFLGVLLTDATRTSMVHVPYKGSLPAVTDLAGGHVAAAYMPYGTVKANVESGKLKILAIASNARPAFAPDIPTFAELGYPMLEAYAWSGLVAPAGTPVRIQKYLQETFNKILAMPDVAEKLVANGHELMANTTEEFIRLIDEDRARWKKAVEISKFSLDR